MLLISRLVYLNKRKNFEMKMLSLKFLHLNTGKVRTILILYTSAKFLIDILKNNPANSPFYTEVLPKGIRSNYFYITDTTKCPMSHITTDDNGAYVKTRNTNKLYCEVGENAHTVHMDDNQYFYNTRNSNTYTRSYVSINDVIML